MLGDGGAELYALIDELAAQLDQAGAVPELAERVAPRLEEWRGLTDTVLQACRRDPQEIGAVSVDFLAYSAYVLLAGLWLQAAVRAQQALSKGSPERGFYQSKLHTADFYWRRLLPRAGAHREALLGGANCLMASDFNF